MEVCPKSIQPQLIMTVFSVYLVVVVMTVVIDLVFDVDLVVAAEVMNVVIVVVFDVDLVVVEAHLL